MQQEELIPIGMCIDKHAKLFKYRNKIIRAINPDYTQLFTEIIDNKVIQELIASNLLILTEISSTTVHGHALVLEHPLLPFVSYPFEWTPSMFKDAALTILKLNLILMKNGFCTQDAHPWNILFDGTLPKFIDFTSIIRLPSHGCWIAIEEFKLYCLNSLLLMAKGYPTMVRSLTHEILCYPDAGLVRELYGSRERLYKRMRNITEKVKRKIRKLRKQESKYAGIMQVERLIKKVESLNVKPRASEWSDYYNGENKLPIYDGTIEVLTSIRHATVKHRLIDNLLETLRPESVLDIGCNRGLYSQIAASWGAKVIGIDMDEQALDQMYCDSRVIGSSVLPLYVNAVAPAEAIGFKEIPFPSVTERLKSECVLCLALVHHLVFKRTHMDFQHIAKVLSSYTEKYLIVEFVPKEDEHVAKWYTNEYNWYCEDNFISALSQYFKKVESYESFPLPRRLLFCEK